MAGNESVEISRPWKDCVVRGQKKRHERFIKGLRLGNEPSREAVISATHTSSFIPSDKWYI